MLSHLVYVSKRNKSCTETEIENILGSCKKNNPSLDISGLLLYSDTKFIQYVEGEYPVLIALFDRIKVDQRHENITLVSMGPIKEKMFPSWHMANKKMELNNVNFLTDITVKDRQAFRNILDGREEKADRVLRLIKRLF